MNRILCIDEDPSTANWIEMVISNAGIKAYVMQIPTGRQAFHELMLNGADLCVLEYALPDMTGVQLCSLMRQTGFDMPFLFFSAMNRPVDRERALQAKANAYLAKPEDLDMFVPTVRRLLSVDEAATADILEFARAA